MLAIFVMTISCSPKENSRWRTESPGKTISVEVALEEGQLYYSAFLHGSDSVIEAIEKSPLGLVRFDKDFSSGLSVEDAESLTIDISYELTSGKRLVNETKATEFNLDVVNQQGAGLTITFRLFDDGIAFRYAFPTASDSLHQVVRELTGFRIPAGARALLQPYDTITTYTPAYEKYFTAVPVGAKSPNPGGWCFPALFQMEGASVLITEAGLDRSYFGAHLTNDEGSALYNIQRPDPAEAFGNGSINASSSLPFSTPWRIVMMAQELSKIVESNLVYHVAQPAAARDFSWVRPGRASWSWWSDQPSPRNFEALRKFVDLAADMGWEYSLVDANWNEMQGGTLEELAGYAASKNVGLWAWYNSGGPHNEVTEQPRDIMWDPLRRKEEMARLKSWGIRGIKVDFFQSDKQFIIEQYLGILADAAENQLMVNFHGCTIPRGWRRTWPNLLSMESVRGAESYIFAREFPENAPLHNVQLVFTRGVIGPMDYTPVTFSDNSFPHRTSYAHELALSVLFESGIQHFADAAEVYGGLQAPVKAFLRQVPVVWDETKLLSGSPDSLAVLARRRNTDWYVAGINGQGRAQEVEVSLAFLEPGNYHASLFMDGETKRSFAISADTLSAADRRPIRMLPEGGFAMWLKKVN